MRFDNKHRKNLGIARKANFASGKMTIWNKGLKGLKIGTPKGTKFSEEHKRKLRISKFWQFSKGMLGHKHSKKSKEKISILNKGRLIGDKNPAWKGGITYNKKFYLKKCNMLRRLKTKGLFIKTIQMVYEDNIKKYGTLTCYLCLKPIPFGKDHLEHKTPLSRGGTNEYDNLAIACQRCNCRKHTKTEEEYRKEICLSC